MFYKRVRKNCLSCQAFSNIFHVLEIFVKEVRRLDAFVLWLCARASCRSARAKVLRAWQGVAAASASDVVAALDEDPPASRVTSDVGANSGQESEEEEEDKILKDKSTTFLFLFVRFRRRRSTT